MNAEHVSNKAESKLDTGVTAKNKSLLIITLVIGSLALLVVGFWGGTAFERSRIRHFVSWQDNYERNFFSPPPGRPGLPPLGRMPRTFKAHNLLGTVLAVEDKKLTVQGSDGVEQSIVLDEQTVLRRDEKETSLGDLKVDQQVAVFGRPNDDGQIVARLIRVF